jgi:hypothetical protein
MTESTTVEVNETALFCNAHKSMKLEDLELLTYASSVQVCEIAGMDYDIDSSCDFELVVIRTIQHMPLEFTDTEILHLTTAAFGEWDKGGRSDNSAEGRLYHKIRAEFDARLAAGKGK